MKFTCNPPIDYELKAGSRDGPTGFPLDTLGPEVQHAALRAIAEYLGPEETIAALGTDANAKQFADAQTREAIRAAGYDPDEMGAAECIVRLAALASAATSRLGLGAQPNANLVPAHVGQAIDALNRDIRGLVVALGGDETPGSAYETSDRAIGEAGYDASSNSIVEALESCARERDTARAQLREWRGMIGRHRGTLANAVDRSALNDSVEVLIRVEARDVLRLLSATPDDGDDSTSKRWQHLYQETQARLDESAAECERLRKRVEELEQGRGMLIDGMAAVQARATRAETAVERLEQEHDRLRKRVEELEVELSRWRAAGEHLGGRLGLPDGPDAVAEALRQYVAAEDALGDRHDHETYQLSEAVREEVEDATDAREALIAAGEDPEEHDDGFGGAVARLLQRAERAETAVEAMRPAVLYFRQRDAQPLLLHHKDLNSRLAAAQATLADYDAGKTAEPALDYAAEVARQRIRELEAKGGAK